MVVDLVSPEARRFESEIDDAYKSSLMLTLPRQEARWWILTASELVAINHFRAGPQRSAIASGDILVYVLRRLFLWTDGLRETRHVVVSKNWIGHWEAQDPEIPIVEMEHLIHEINETHDVERVGLWLKERKYLPVEGSDFEIIWRDRQIFGRQFRWYGLRLLHVT